VRQSVVSTTSTRAGVATPSCQRVCLRARVRRYSGPGSFGYEKQDAQYMADAGADYVKEVCLAPVVPDSV